MLNDKLQALNAKKQNLEMCLEISFNDYLFNALCEVEKEIEDFVKPSNEHILLNPEYIWSRYIIDTINEKINNIK